MTLRWRPYLLTALLFACILSFGLNYRELLLLPKFNLSFSTGLNSGLPELAIRLDPETHCARAPRTIYFQWEITKGYRSPDGVQKLLYLINGEFPGPTIEARSGDRLVVEVQNLLENQGVAIHWHGLHMRGANAMDGAVGITQNPISPGDTFTYDFQIEDDQAGTFWYHSHSGLQRADGLYGGLLIYQPRVNEPRKYDYEHETLLMIGDLYHRPAEEVQASYVNHESWGREPVPDSLLINGRGKFNCSMAVKSRPLQCEDIPLSQITLPQGRSRMRVVNVGAMSGFVLTMPHCKMTVIHIDGGNKISPSPPSSSLGILYPGERFDMIVECDPTSDSHLSITLDPENFAIPNPALTPTHHFPLYVSSSQLAKRGHSYHPPSIIPSEDFFNFSAATALPLRQNSMPETPSQALVVYIKMEVLAHLGNVPAGFMNRTSWSVQDSPPQPLIELERDKYDTNQLVPLIPMGDGEEVKWVDMVVNNLDEKGHPFHLHGYDFFILASYTPPRRGYHAYNPFSTQPSDASGGPYNTHNPLKKDTVYVPSQGYVVLRIRADNPGIWFFHCHILWHSGAGMGMALEVA